MTNEDIRTLYEVEKQRNRAEERKRKETMDKEFREASHSESFTVFNSVIGTVTVICSLLFCVYFLWENSKPLLLIVTAMVTASFVFRRLSKHYFVKGDRRRFEAFNKLAGIAGVASSLFELADLRSSKSRGALDKADSVESSIGRTINTIAESTYRGGIYNDVKYDTARNRSLGTGKYIYSQMDLAKLYQLLEDVKVKSDSAGVSKDSRIKLSILSMYIRDSLDNAYAKSDITVFYSCIGALHYFMHPLNEIPNYVPLIGYQDEMFMTYCVYAGNNEHFEEYKNWKLELTKQELVSKSLKNTEDIWDTLISKSHVIKMPISELLKRSTEKVYEDYTLDNELLKSVRILNDIITDWNNGKYVITDTRKSDGMLGTLGYWVLQHDLIPDNLSAMGYVDDLIVIRCCVQHCTDIIEDYTTWKRLNNVYEEKDPLIEYLNAVVGPSELLRRAEIQRLSKLCTDVTLTNEVDRARLTIKDII